MTSKRYKEIAARARVPLGFVNLAVYLVYSRPSWIWFLPGATVALAGILLRGWAVGHLAKNRELCTGGPYRHTRNPLYLGSALTGAGFAIAGGVWWLGVLTAAVLVFVYWPVVLEEESHLRDLFPAFAGYAARVPRFWPSPAPRVESTARFQWALYKRNQEYNAVICYVVVMAILIWKMIG